MEVLLLKRIFRIFGLAMVVVAVLAVALAGTALAASPADNGAQTQNQTQNQGEVCPCEEGPCGDCVCADCEPNEYSNLCNHLGPGQWKAQTGK